MNGNSLFTLILISFKHIIIKKENTNYTGTIFIDNNNLKEARRLVEAFVSSTTPHIYWHARGYILMSDICRKEGKLFEANEYLRTLRANYPGSEIEIFNLIDERLK